MCATASDMHRLLLSGERPETLEDDVDVTERSLQVEDRLERRNPQRSGDLRIGGDELAEVAAVLPPLHRVPLDEPVGVVAAEPRLHEREQQAVAEDKPVAPGRGR